LEEHALDGLVEWDGSTLAVTRSGRPFVRTIAAAFDAYLAPGSARHSASV
jgi:oxygen-independent coproporphyrinogen III oxidase